MEINQTKLNSCYPSGITGNGVFTDLQSFDVPWKDKNINASLDIAYYGQHSGKKVISSFVENFLPDSGSTITDENRVIIAKCLFAVYGNNWKHLWETTQQEYNMLWNTDATIVVDTSNEGTNNKTTTGTQTGTDTHKLSGSDTTTKDLTDSTTTSGTDTTLNTGTDTHTLGGTDTTDHTGTDNHDITNDTDTTDTGTDTTYHHSKTVQYNTTGGSHDNTTTTQNKIAGFDSTGTGQNTTYSIVTEDKAIVTKTYHALEDSEFNDEKESFTNSDIEERNLKGSSKATGSDNETVALKDATKYGRTDTETLNTSEATTYGKGETETISGTEAKTEYDRTDTETLNLSNGATENGGDTFTGKETTRRTGNIGVTTNQQMIEAERELWKWNFFNYIFKDIDRYLTLAVY